MAPPRVILFRFKLAATLAGLGALSLATGCSGAGAEAPSDPRSPSLAILDVSPGPGAGSAAAITLVPTFSPDVHDYYVRCTSGLNSLAVSMSASEGAESLLVQPTASASLPQQTISVAVTEDQAVVAAATNGSATVEYWVRCLPHDFPQYTWTAHPRAGTPTAGFYLVGTGAVLGPGGMPAAPTSGCFAMVLDGEGVPVWYRRSSWANGFCVFDVDQVVPGAISFDSIGDSPAQFEMHALSPLGTSRVDASTSGGALNVDLHELRSLPNGDFLVISSPAQPGVDLTGMRVPLPDGSSETLSGPQTILGCDLLEVGPGGDVVWSWRATDHFDPVAVSTTPTLTSAGPFGKNLVDPFHCNSIDVEPGTGNLLVSAREMNSVFEVERSTGRVMWKMGGPSSSKDGASYVSVADPFVEQHDARFAEDWSADRGGSGSISMFDDESDTSRPARAVVYRVAVGGADVASSGTATVTWQHDGLVSSPAMGSFRISADGSRVIGWGMASGGGFTEVDSGGHDLLDFGFTDENATYRAIKVPPSAFDRNALRTTAGLP